MAQNDVHELTAAYALDALDEREQREYEEHLAGCERCRVELAELTETASLLAYAVEAAPPPPALRQRILDVVHEEGTTVVSLRPRRPALYALAAAAAAAAVIAVAVGLWAASLNGKLNDQRDALHLLSDPHARVVDLRGADGRLVVASDGKAALVTRGLGAAPPGKRYEIWVVEGKTPRPAGLFAGKSGGDTVLLDREVPRGAVVAVTVEDKAGADAPTQTPFITAQA